MLPLPAITRQDEPMGIDDGGKDKEERWVDAGGLGEPGGTRLTPFPAAAKPSAGSGDEASMAKPAAASEKPFTSPVPISNGIPARGGFRGARGGLSPWVVFKVARFGRLTRL